ncbi:hypothetical protein HQ576_19115 [bacterium]|nr:hypothetical protein [bacterium]
MKRTVVLPSLAVLLAASLSQVGCLKVQKQVQETQAQVAQLRADVETRTTQILDVTKAHRTSNLKQVQGELAKVSQTVEKTMADRVAASDKRHAAEIARLQAEVAKLKTDLKPWAETLIRDQAMVFSKDIEALRADLKKLPDDVGKKIAALPAGTDDARVQRIQDGISKLATDLRGRVAKLEVQVTELAERPVAPPVVTPPVVTPPVTPPTPPARKAEDKTPEPATPSFPPPPARKAEPKTPPVPATPAFPPIPPPPAKSTVGAVEKVHKVTIGPESYSKIYQAVWFCPDDATIAPLKEKSEEPPLPKFSIWIEPGDPEMNYLPGKRAAKGDFVMIGSGMAAFKRATRNTPGKSKDKLRRAELSQKEPVFLYRERGKTWACIVLELDTTKKTMSFMWRELTGQSPAAPVKKGDAMGQEDDPEA